MADELAFVLINPYTIAKSRTGGVIARFLSRTGLELAAARMFYPSRELIDKYAQIVMKSENREPAVRQLLSDYILNSYAPNLVQDRPRRVLMLLLEGEDAVRKVRDMTGSVMTGTGDTIRDTFGDYVVDENKQVKYFEPAVLIGPDREETIETLKLWARYSESDGGLIHDAVDVSKEEKGWQKTLVLIKPDNFRFPSSRPGNIIDMLSRSGLRIIAAKVHRMSVVQAEAFYQPIRQGLREKMGSQVGEKAGRALQTEFNMEIPPHIKSLLEEHLGPLVGDEQFNRIVRFMTGYYPPQCTDEEKRREGRQKCLALVYAGVNAVEIIRGLLGTTDPSTAPLGSVRRELGSDIMVNAAHASDSVENAERELGIIQVEQDTIRACVEQYYGS